MITLYIYYNKKRFKNLKDLIHVKNYSIEKTSHKKYLLIADAYGDKLEFFCKKVKCKKDIIYLIKEV